ncbi:hypothetical protein AUJ68_06345 [Candidatus Woesearchaeota archaeon CG1_02_57_44]|nr:MAG: hypothetical protein AUJ68_06345 [Candidatus Woesearchaeota archaeon CG1_02_57_44]
MDQLQGTVSELALSQAAWKGKSRLQNSISYQQHRGGISERQAAWYEQHPVRWYAREGTRLTGKAIRYVSLDVPGKAWQGLVNAARQFLPAARHWGRCVVSSPYRMQALHDYVDDRITFWEGRKQLSADEAAHLRSQLTQEHTSSFITDVMGQALLKPLEALLFPSLATALYSSGVIDEAQAGALVVAGGSISRSAYTMVRMLQDRSSRKGPADAASPGDENSRGFIGRFLDNRGVALLWGAIPTAGNLAYPLQMVYSGSTSDHDLGAFLVYDAMSRLGRKIPIYGGENSGTEHALCRLPDVLVRQRGLSTVSICQEV